MPEHDLALLVTAARAAGDIALRFWKRSPRVWEKPGQGPVTEADYAVNTALAERLRPARPEYGWLSEEDEDSAARQDCARVFIIDPIDGTRAFIAGEEGYALSLAIAERGRVVAGVVYLPALDRLYTATAHGPALRDGQPIRASDRAGIAGARVLTTKPNMLPEHWPGGVPAVERAFRSSLAYRLCLVAEGRFDGMVTLRQAWEWDIAAGALIAARAGAVVTDRRDRVIGFNAVDPRATGVIAATPGLHAALMARLLPVA